MKVIIVTPYFYPHPGGVENYSLNMAKQLKVLGWQVVVVTTAKQKRLAVKNVQGFKTYHLPARFTVSNTPLGWFWRRQLKKIYAYEQPDVINAHTPVPYLADIAERARGSIPFVLSYHNDLTKNSWPYKTLAVLVNKLLTVRTLKRSERIIATSQFYVNSSSYLKPHLDKVKIVPPGVDSSLFNPNVSSASLRSKYKDSRVILFVGSLNRSQRHKGLHVLIEAFSELKHEQPDTKLVVVGSGNAIEEYKDHAKNAGVGSDVVFKGRVSDAQLAQYYALASVFAMPSTNSNEGFGMVFIEASASGTPVIGTTVGGIPFAIEDGKTGLLASPGSSSSLHKDLSRILSDRSYAANLGRAGAKRAAKDFDWHLLAKKTADIYMQAAKPRIIQVAGYYPPHLGGMERVAETMSEQLAARGYEVRVLTSDVNAKTGDSALQDGLRIRRFRAWEFAHTPIAPGIIPALLTLPRRRTVIHLHLAQAYYPELVWLTSKLHRTPYVVHFHLDLRPSGLFGPIFLLYKSSVLRVVIKGANRVIVFTPEQQSFVQTKYHLPLERIAVIPNGVDSSYFLPPRQFSSSSKRLLFVGRLAPQKQLPLLLKSMSLLPDSFKLTIVGDGEERAELEKQAKGLGLSNVQFTGAKTPTETLSYYKQADAFVIASEREGMPLVILEAMAARLPVVGNNVGGIIELVAGVGILVDKPDPEAFASSLKKLMDNPKALTRLSRQSAAAAERYSWDKLINNFETLYGALLS